MTAEQLRIKVLNFKDSNVDISSYYCKKREGNQIFNEAIVYVGIDNYKNNSNIRYSCFSKNPFVAFFSHNEELSFYLVLSILLRSHDEASTVMNDMYGQKTIYSSNDLANYLAIQRHFFFLNVKDRFFISSMNKIINAHNKIKILKLFKSNRMGSQKMSNFKKLLKSKKVDHSTIIHPSTKNRNSISKDEWFRTHIMNNYKGKIDTKFSYQNFAI